MKKNRGDEPIGVIIHIYMELSQRNSLCGYFYLKQAKIPFFLFFFYKIREQEGGTVLPREGCYQWRGKVAGKGYKGVNTMQKMCTHVPKCKISYLLKLFQESGKGG
jgi:hypothetical protein